MKNLIFILLLLTSVYGCAQNKVTVVGGAGVSLPKLPHKYLNGYGAFPTLNTDSITQGTTNKFATNPVIRAAISLTTTGSGAATYNSATGVFNIPVGGAGGGVTSINTRTGAVTLTKTDVGLSNVDNTSDASKPLSAAATTAFGLKANLASPTFTGTVSGITKTMVGLSNADNTSDANKPLSTADITALGLKADALNAILTGVPQAPTASGGTNTTQIATTAFVTAAVAASVTGVSQVVGFTGAVTLANLVSGGVQSTLIAGTDYITPAGQTSTLASYATLASPTLTGVPAAPTATVGTNTTQLATTAFVAAAVAASTTGVSQVVGFTGAVTLANLVSGGVQAALVAGTDYITPSGLTTALIPYATLSSPTLTGTPQAPTAAGGTNTTQIATTAFVAAAVAASTTGVSQVVGFTGAVTLANLVSGGVQSTLIAGTDYVTPSAQTTALNLKANLASPTLTGTPAAPTATLGTNTTQIATTAFVAAAVAAVGGGSVSTVSVASANGFTGVVANPTTTPSITIRTSITGILKGNGTAMSAAVAGVDYVIPSGNVATVTTNANLTGDVTSVGNATTLKTVNANLGTFNNVTVNAKGLVTAASNVSYLTVNQSISFAPTGDVTGSTSGTTSLTPVLTIASGSVTLAKLANMNTGSIYYRTTAGVGPPEVHSITQLLSDLNLTNVSVGLGNVNNTTDLAKPVSTATQTALNGKLDASYQDSTALDYGLQMDTTLHPKQLELRANQPQNINAQTGTSYTLLQSDVGRVITFNSSSAITLTIPSGLLAGFNCTIIQIGSGNITFSASGTTLHQSGSLTKTLRQYSTVTINSYVTNVFNLVGEMQ